MNQVEADVKRALTLLEPALILGMGGDCGDYHGHPDGHPVCQHHGVLTLFA